MANANAEWRDLAAHLEELDFVLELLQLPVAPTHHKRRGSGRRLLAPRSHRRRRIRPRNSARNCRRRRRTGAAAVVRLLWRHPRHHNTRAETAFATCASKPLRSRTTLISTSNPKTLTPTPLPPSHATTTPLHNQSAQPIRPSNPPPELLS
jgi:hypothetical protein